ncbi:MAG: type II toxin-antitoxin system VapC family toxin [Gemmatimonadaceae bacterium]
MLDTDICIWIIRGRESVIARLRAESPDDVAIASMTEAELRFGALNSSDPERAGARVEAFLEAPFAVLPFDGAAARAHAEARMATRGRRIGEADLVIASTAIAAGYTLVTGNVREFARVPRLTHVSWVA